MCVHSGGHLLVLWPGEVPQNGQSTGGVTDLFGSLLQPSQGTLVYPRSSCWQWPPGLLRACPPALPACAQRPQWSHDACAPGCMPVVVLCFPLWPAREPLFAYSCRLSLASCYRPTWPSDLGDISTIQWAATIASSVDLLHRP